MIFSILFLISSAFAQWIDMPECPYGMQYVGNECQNAFGQTACPVGYYFDSVQGKCIGKAQTNTNCPQGSVAGLDDFGQPICDTPTAAESVKSPKKNESDTSRAIPSKLRACESAHARAKRTCQPTTAQTPNRLQ